jgi:hypothetical protein
MPRRINRFAAAAVARPTAIVRVDGGRNRPPDGAVTRPVGTALAKPEP